MKKKTLSNKQRLHRFRVTLAIIIAATIPCYCSGLILLKYYPQENNGTATPTVVETTLLSTLTVPTQTISTPTLTFSPTTTMTPKWTASMTYTPFLSPTTTITPTFTETPIPTETEIPSDTAVPFATPSFTPSVNSTEEVTP